jgi:hypothetical protein
VDPFTRNIADDDLDELMNRVREAALGTGSSRSATPVAETPADVTSEDSGVIKVIDAQGQLNEHLRKALGELVECLRTLRDDWADAHEDLRREIGQLSAVVRKRRRTPAAASARRKPQPRGDRARRAKKRGRPRS